MIAMKRVNQAIPIFAVRDLDEAIRHYRDKLGFTIAWSWGDPPLRVGAALDAIEIQLVGPATPDLHGWSVVYCLMVGVEEYYAACRARGAVIAMELGARPWGVRDFRVIDPSGNRIGFAE
jgi:catechol 2,3-dioxygenase-like lactoylglutathione lyase family enzyme